MALLLTHFHITLSETLSARKNHLALQSNRQFGGRGRDRTGDPLLAKQVLSQLSYTPTAGTAFDFKVFAVARKLRKTLVPETLGFTQIFELKPFAFNTSFLFDFLLAVNTLPTVHDGRPNSDR